MNTTETKREIEQLKSQLKATHKQNDFRLLKMAFVLALLAIAAGIMYGKIQLW